MALVTAHFRASSRNTTGTTEVKGLDNPSIEHGGDTAPQPRAAEEGRSLNQTVVWLVRNWLRERAS